MVLACLVGSAFLFVVFLVGQVGAKHPMFDLSLLRKPTFTGGLIAAFGVSASIFSLLTYLVLYVQGVLGFSAVAVRLPPPVPVRRRPSSSPRSPAG